VISLTPAEQLLQDLGITEPEEINLEAIACHQGAFVRYEPLDRCEAYIMGNGDRAIITVNSRSQRPRQRYSAGHELGHWHHHRGITFICRASDIGDQAIVSKLSEVERTADNYAADLLMPRYLFKPVIDQFAQITLEAVRQLAHRFQTSLTATAIRFVEMSITPAIVACYGHNGRKWFRSGLRVPQYLFPKKELDHCSHAFGVLFGSERFTCMQSQSADVWFNHRGACCCEIYEQSVRVWDDEIITVLWWKDESMFADAA